jgi:L-asparaginase
MATPRPRVHIVATGGSISGLGPHRLDYVLYPELGQRLRIEEMLARIPEAHEVAQVEGENLLRVGSTAVGLREWLELAQRINQVLHEDASLAGVVVTHGTATLEETAYQNMAEDHTCKGVGECHPYREFEGMQPSR